MKKTQYVLLVVILVVVIFIAVACDFENTGDRPYNNFFNPKSSQSPTPDKVEPRVQATKPIQTNNLIATTLPSVSERNMEDTGSGIGKGKIISIDPGHQSKGNSSKEALAPNSSVMKDKTTSGADGINSKTPEYIINLSVSKKLKAALEKKGFEVVMTRESNEVDLSNIERAKIANDAKSNLSIRIHADSSSSQSARGMSMLIPSKKYVKDTQMIENSKIAGGIILKKTIEKTAAISRGIVEREDMTGFNWSKVPTVLLEMGFLSNHEEDKLLNSENYQNKIVEGIVEGVIEYFKK